MHFKFKMYSHSVIIRSVAADGLLRQTFSFPPNFLNDKFSPRGNPPRRPYPFRCSWCSSNLSAPAFRKTSAGAGLSPPLGLSCRLPQCLAPSVPGRRCTRRVCGQDGKIRHFVRLSSRRIDYTRDLRWTVMVWLSYIMKFIFPPMARMVAMCRIYTINLYPFQQGLHAWDEGDW